AAAAATAACNGRSPSDAAAFRPKAGRRPVARPPGSPASQRAAKRSAEPVSLVATADNRPRWLDARYARRSDVKRSFNCIHTPQCGKPRSAERGSSEGLETAAMSLRFRSRGSEAISSARVGLSITEPNLS
ncbi:hypothetical protein Vafri_2430, partial [Volvox africanus]